MLGAPGERTGAAVEFGEQGAWEGALPGTVCSVLGKGGVPAKGGFPSFPEAFPPGILFVTTF